MLTYKDCLDWSDLDQNEVDAIAEHEHMDQILALCYGQQICQSGDASRRMRRIIIDDIHHAELHHNATHAQQLKRLLRHYIKTHPV